MSEIVSVKWLKENLENEDLILLDASMPKAGKESTAKGHEPTIPGARQFDLKSDFSDRSSDLPNTVPPKEQFQEECQKLGINQDSHIVVFDDLGVYSSPRVWWMFKIMGHGKISVLNGGLPEWVNQGYATEERKKQQHMPGNFTASITEELIIHYPDVENNIQDRAFTLIDARSEGRFTGTAPEPRKELKSGHIEGSINIPFQNVLTNGMFKSKEELRKLFEEKCDMTEKLVFSCGSGVTACIVLLACEIANKQSRYVYDGSWTEWTLKKGLKEIN